MTTDQPAVYCPCNWRCHRETQPCSLSCLSHVFEPAPTPTSSLEGARAVERLVAASAIPGPDWHDMLLMMHDHHAGEHDWSAKDPYDCSICHAGIESFEERACAAARAEVIREVEELAEDALTLSIMLAAPKSARTEGYEDIRDLRAHAATLARRLRALSQGGEG